MRRILPALFASAAMLFAAPAHSQELHTMLSYDQVQQLSPEAAEYYQRASVADDHVNYDETVRLLAKAAEIDVKNSDLQFLTAMRARQRAEIYYSETTYSSPAIPADYYTPPWQTAEQYINIVEASLNRIAANADLPAEQRIRLKIAQATLEARRAAIGERDKARIEAGEPIYDYYRDTRYEALLKNLPDDAQIGSDEMAQRIIKAMGLAGVKVTSAAGQELTPPTDADKDKDKADPFAILPGEYIEPFLPPPPPPPGANYSEGTVAGGAIDPFANPAGNPGGDFSSQPVDGNPPPADPALGGGGGK